MGFEKVIIKEGNGTRPVQGKAVTVHCTGYGKNGDLSKPFWSTKDPGQEPFSFKIGLGKGTSIFDDSYVGILLLLILLVIKGWDEGVMTMTVGEVARITCTPDYGYGKLFG